MAGNNKATIQKLYDVIIPIVEDVAAIKTDIVTIKAQLINVTHGVDLSGIQLDIKEIKDDMKSKISSKAFAAWLGSLSVIIGIIITIISFIFLRG